MDARNKSALTLALPSDREIVMTRVFDVPRRLVFEAWTNPAHVKHWYGCSIMTLDACEIDLRVGGAYRFTMRGPDGVRHTMQGTYREIAAPGRLVFTEGYVTEGFSSNEAVVTVTFTERDGRTTLTSHSLYPSAADRDGHLNAGIEAGASETLDRLAAHLATMA